MSSLSRMLSVLDLFNADAPIWTAESIADRINCSIPTAYRYLRELIDVGLERTSSPGQYVLGNRIVELDYQLRMGDPFLQASQKPIHKLVMSTDCDVALAALSGHHLLTLHYESSQSATRASYGRGRRLPVSKGAMSLALLSILSKPALRKLLAANATESGNSENEPRIEFEDLFEQLKEVKKTGYATSIGALESKNAAISIPVLDEANHVFASLGFVMSVERFQMLESDRAATLLRQCAQEISQALTAATAPIRL